MNIYFDITRYASRGSGSKGGMVKITSLFFDRPIVEKYLDKRTRTVYAKFGAYVRRAAQWSMKKAPKDHPRMVEGKVIRTMKTSRPGQPPYKRSGLLKRFIFYSLDWANRSVVIGPVRFKAGTTNVPEVLEYGGVSEVFDRRHWERKKVRVASRPYMNPAFLKGKQQLSRLWRESIH
jgi:hypothetical protein